MRAEASKGLAGHGADRCWMACCPVLAITENKSGKMLIRCHPGRELRDLAAGSYYAAPHTPHAICRRGFSRQPYSRARAAGNADGCGVGRRHLRAILFCIRWCSLRNRGGRSARAWVGA